MKKNIYRPVFISIFHWKGNFAYPPVYASSDRLARSPYTSPCWLGCNYLGWKCVGNRDRKYIRNLWRRTTIVHRTRGELRLVSKRTSRTLFAAWDSVVLSIILFSIIYRKRIADRRLRILLRTRASQVLSGNTTILLRTIIISFT